MAAPNRVVLILGAGPNIGKAVAQKFAGKGYKIALASRSAKGENTADQVHIASDLSDPASVPNAFAEVKKLLGSPSVVIYNAAAYSRGEPAKPLSVSVSDFTRDLHINTTSAYVAAQEAASAFEQLPAFASRTFLYTGNIMNTGVILAPIMTLGVGKSATAHIIQTAASAYKDQGFKFYYCDERTAEGGPVYQDVDGEAAAAHYLELAEGKEQGPWLQTFVKGQGYKHFTAPPKL